MTHANRSKHAPGRRGALTMLCGLFAACAPTPSAQPLGWGPLAPGMRGELETHAARGPSKNKTAPHREAVAIAEPKPKVSETETHAPAEVPKASTTEPAKPDATKPKGALVASAFVGEYKGEDVAVYRIEGMPDRTEKDPKALLNVTAPSDNKLSFVLVDSSNGKDICTLEGTLGEAGVAIGKGQKCFEQNTDEASASATVLSGTASMEGARLVFDLDMSFAMEVAGRKLGGSLSYHFDGARK